MGWKEKKVDKLIARMRNGEEVIFFRDDDVFNESMFDAYAVLQDRVRTSGAILYSGSIHKVIVGEHTYLWEGDRVVLQEKED